MFLLAVIHQTTTMLRMYAYEVQCFYWRLYIKPQPCGVRSRSAPSVSIGGYTSNHNLFTIKNSQPCSVSIGGYTSNHNLAVHQIGVKSVFLLAVIHQTTTESWVFRHLLEVFLLAVIHQTTTTPSACLSARVVFLLAVIHQTTTSQGV